MIEATAGDNQSRRDINWRDLKKELFDTPPRQRSNKTMDRTDIFNAKNAHPKPKENRVNPTNKPSHVLSIQMECKTPQRVRSTKTLESVVFTQQKEENKTNNIAGKRTYKQSRTLLFDEANKNEKTRLENPHKIQDHGSEWFYHANEKDRPRLLKSAQKCTQRVKTSENVKSTQEKKQEELYKTEISSSINPKCLILEFKKFQKPQESDTTEYRSATPLQKRVMDNNSNIFNNQNQPKTCTNQIPPLMFRRNDEEYQSTIEWNNPFYEKRNTEVNEKATFERQYASRRRDEEQCSPNVSHSPTKYIGNQNQEQDEALILKTQQSDQIKKVNQNYSDVFGLEYGAKKSIQKEKGENRDLASVLGWHNVDSVKNDKDIGIKKKNNKKQLEKQKSRVDDQQSSLDTHAFYSNKKDNKDQQKFSSTYNNPMNLRKSTNRKPFVK